MTQGMARRPRVGAVSRPLQSTAASRPARRVTGALDWLLDKSIAPGYSRLGYSIRRHWWPADPAPGALAGTRVLVTGATSGLGMATAVGLAGLGAAVHVLGRNPERVETARAGVLASAPGAEVVTEVCDLSDLAAVARFTDDLAARTERLHALVHNAGVMPPGRTETPQGHELAFATHILGPHLMTGRLRPLLRRDGDARVVFVSSGGMYAHRLRVDDPEYLAGSYSGPVAYARTKRMQVVLAELWADELVQEHVAAHSMHPGWADTPGIQDSLPGFRRLTRPVLRDAAQGADTAVWLAAAAQAGRTTGLFWHDRRPRPTSYLPWVRDAADDRRRLWQLASEATARW